MSKLPKAEKGKICNGVKIDILTLFPKMFNGFLSESIIKRAINSKKISIAVHNIRDYAKDKHKKVDSRPFGGGCGMVLEMQPVFDALFDVKKNNKDARVVLMSPQGALFTQEKAYELSQKKGIIIISAHYEGIDERIKDMIDDEVSIGNYVLTGGEIPAMVIIDAAARLIPGVLGHSDSSKNESLCNDSGLLEYPQYARPAVFKNMPVPKILLSGNHSQINLWRKQQAISRTMNKRPDLIKNIKQLELL